MMAGPYAVVDGVTYPAGRLDGDIIWVDVPEGDPAPSGLTRPSHPQRRGIRRSEVSRLFVARTSARWRGREATVDTVFGDEAGIEVHGADFDGRPELYLADRSVWRGRVPVDSLTDVVEEVVEVSL